MRLDPDTGWLDGVRRLPSPNFDARPDGVGIDLLVVHGISLPAGEFGGPYIDQLFTNCLDCAAHPSFSGLATLRVSAHLLVRRDGEVTQYVSIRDRAWHAGRSTFQGRGRCNDFSVGVEMEGADEVPYADAQYQRLAEIASLLLNRWPALKTERIVGHSDIAPGRKTDPGPAFDWERFRGRLMRVG